MRFLPADLIRKKRFGGTHTREELNALIQGYTVGEIPDYQISAWLMAVCLKGMSEQETAWLTQEMRDSGTTLDLQSLGLTVDKHSTGGVGDKISLVLAPIVAAAGVPVPMLAGRGLGHTGGTLDKLESIPGFSVALSHAEFRQQVATLGLAIMGQTADICPADRKLYALRDVTGTVDSLPLICGSIMSKKLAAGVSALVLDVKFGSGAFMKSLEDAEKLARALKQIGELSGQTVQALLTNMNEPLGRAIGNSLEVQECLDILEGKTWSDEGKGYSDVLTLTLELAAHMIQLGGKAVDIPSARALAVTLLESGQALKKFEVMCQAQGAQWPIALPQAKQKLEVVATQSGFLNYTDVSQLGMASIWLGAGRRTQADVIDAAAGIEVFRAQGQAVKQGDVLFRLWAKSPEKFEQCRSSLVQAYSITVDPVAPYPLVAKVII